MMRPFFDLRTLPGLVRTGVLAGTLLASLFIALRIAAGLRRPAPILPPRAEAAPPPPELRGRRLAFPVRGIPPATVIDTFTDPRSGARVHEAVDIMAPRGTPVVAADDGMVMKLHASGAGGTSVYQFDRDGKFGYFYGHLHGYAPGLREGQAVRRGDVLGYVGSTGNAPESAPHLHFAIFKVVSPAQWWGGEAINPYPLWR